MTKFQQVLALLWAISVATSNPFAQDATDWRGPHDYYRAVDGAQHELLVNVEKYHLPQGEEKLKRGRLQYAFEDFDFVLRYFPNHPQALMLMTQTVEKMNKPRRADEYFRTAIELFPNQPATLGLYGVHLHRSGDIARAIEYYNRALQLDPDSAETHYNLGLAYLSQKNYDLANQHAQKAYRLAYPLPGLRDRLQQVGRWQPGE